MLLTVPDDILPGKALPLLDGDECFRAFPPMGVRDGDDAAFEDVRMGYNQGFDGEGGDVFTAWGGAVSIELISRAFRLGYSPEIMMSFARSKICTAPSGCHTARSPECSRPPAKSFLVASSSL